MIFCYHVNRFLTFSLLLKYLPTKEKIVKKFKQTNKQKQFKTTCRPPPPPDGQCRFLLEVKQMPQWLVSSEVLTTHKVWGEVLFDHFQFCSILSDIRSYKLKWLIEVLKMFKRLSAWKVLQNKVFINQEQSVLTKQGVYKRSMSPHVLFHSTTLNLTLSKTSTCAFS